jgi:hypothetical protein
MRIHIGRDPLSSMRQKVWANGRPLILSLFLAACGVAALADSLGSQPGVLESDEVQYPLDHAYAVRIASEDGSRAEYRLVLHEKELTPEQRKQVETNANATLEGQITVTLRMDELGDPYDAEDTTLLSHVLCKPGPDGNDCEDRNALGSVVVESIEKGTISGTLYSSSSNSPTRYFSQAISASVVADFSGLPAANVRWFGADGGEMGEVYRRHSAAMQSGDAARVLEATLPERREDLRSLIASNPKVLASMAWMTLQDGDRILSACANDQTGHLWLEPRQTPLQKAYITFKKIDGRWFVAHVTT